MRAIQLNLEGGKEKTANNSKLTGGALVLQLNDNNADKVCEYCEDETKGGQTEAFPRASELKTEKRSWLSCIWHWLTRRPFIFLIGFLAGGLVLYLTREHWRPNTSATYLEQEQIEPPHVQSSSFTWLRYAVDDLTFSTRTCNAHVSQAWELTLIMKPDQYPQGISYPVTCVRGKPP